MVLSIEAVFPNSYCFEGSFSLSDCKCIDGWTKDENQQCLIDINECDAETDPCPEIEHSSSAKIMEATPVIAFHVMLQLM